MDQTYAVKVLLPGKKRWKFMANTVGDTTSLRIRALCYKDSNAAGNMAAMIEDYNPGIKAKVVTLYPKGGAQ